MRTAVLLIAGAVMLAGPARAADDLDIVKLDDRQSGQYGWSGLYAGVGVGYGWLRDVDRAFAPPFVSSGDDWVFDVHAGYLYQWNQMVFGAEVAYNSWDIQFDGLPVFVEDGATIRVRAGFAYQRWLFSIHGGATYATTNIALDDWGYNIGLAAEYMVTENITAGIQYDHHDFSNFDGTLIDATLDTLTLRVGYKF